jgi:hypothetical protein
MPSLRTFFRRFNAATAEFVKHLTPRELDALNEGALTCAGQMWELALKLLEKLQSLVVEHERVDEKRFVETVKSIMDALDGAHADYLTALQEVEHKAQDSSLRDLTNTLETVRTRKETTRRKIAAMAYEFSQNKKLNKYHRFFELVARHFGSLVGLEASTYMSIIAREIERFHVTGDRTALISVIRGYREQVQMNWIELSHEYARIVAQRV